MTALIYQRDSRSNRHTYLGKIANCKLCQQEGGVQGPVSSVQGPLEIRFISVKTGKVSAKGHCEFWKE